MDKQIQRQKNSKKVIRLTVTQTNGHKDKKQQKLPKATEILKNYRKYQQTTENTKKTTENMKNPTKTIEINRKYQ